MSEREGKDGSSAVYFFWMIRIIVYISSINTPSKCNPDVGGFRGRAECAVLTMQLPGRPPPML